MYEHNYCCYCDYKQASRNDNVGHHYLICLNLFFSFLDFLIPIALGIFRNLESEAVFHIIIRLIIISCLVCFVVFISLLIGIMLAQCINSFTFWGIWGIVKGVFNMTYFYFFSKKRLSWNLIKIYCFIIFQSMQFGIILNWPCTASQIELNIWSLDSSLWPILEFHAVRLLYLALKQSPRV